MTQPAQRDGGESTRELLLDAAEQMFAELGVEAVSLRQVGQRAGQRNNSVAQYHFGSREGLVRAIVERRSAPVDARRRELQATLGDPVQASVEDLVRLWVQPLAEAVGTPGAPTWYLRFLAQLVEQGDEATLRLVSAEAPTLREVRRGLRLRLGQQSRPVLDRRLRWMAQVTLRVLADQEREAAAGTRRRASPETVVTDLVRMLGALLEAP